MGSSQAQERHDPRVLALKAGLLTVWATVSFVLCFFARDLEFVIAGWPFSYWMGAQGAVLVFIAIVTVDATVMKRLAPEDSLPARALSQMSDPVAYAAYKLRLHRLVAIYIVGLTLFMALMAWAERSGLSRFWLGPIFLFSSSMLYAGIGIYCRTTDPREYYVAGRGIPAVYNGMAAAADWMSAASFISMAGGLYLQGFGGTEGQAGGLAYVLGWTGGFCLVALLIAPHLRKLKLYTVPDYFSVRYGGRWPRVIAALAAVLCSFTYVIAQIYGIGLIASRLTGVQFEIGILLGLGGVLLCSFLGGMRAITWTQVAQYVILLLAFLIPVSWLAYKQLGNPLAPLVYGAQLQKISQLEKQLAQDPAEQQVAAIFLARAHEYEARLQDIDGALAARACSRQAADPRAQVAGCRFGADRPGQPRSWRRCPGTWRAAREQWVRADARELRARQAARRRAAAQPAVRRAIRTGTAAEQDAFNTSRLNFLALMFCLMVGTAGPAAPADALLHHADRGRGALVRRVDAVLHRAGVPERAGAGGAGEVRSDEQSGGQQLRRACRRGSRSGPRSIRR